MREYKLAYYSSLALKEAGLTTNDISGLLDLQQQFRQGQYDKWIDAGLPDTEAQLRANSTVDQVAATATIDVSGTGSWTEGPTAPWSTGCRPPAR